MESRKSQTSAVLRATSLLLLFVVGFYLIVGAVLIVGLLLGASSWLIAIVAFLLLVAFSVLVVYGTAARSQGREKPDSAD